MSSISNQNREFLKRTQDFWQAQTAEKLTLEDARVCAENIACFFDILKEWDEAASLSRCSESGER